MYNVNFNQMYAYPNTDKSQEVTKCYPVQIIVDDLERALALASLLQKISTSAVQFQDICVNDCKPVTYEKV